MIAAFMLHALAVSGFCAAAAWLMERALGSLGGPRRIGWGLGIAASITIPMLALMAPHAGGDPARGLVATPQAIGAAGTATRIATHVIVLPEVAAGPGLEVALGAAWAALSAAAIAAYLITALRLARRARRWSSANIAEVDLLVANDLGPAVFGLWRPRVVFPRWLLAAPLATQRLVLAHEGQHVAARDPLLLAAALTLAALFPWNFALLWQLRRLRFAIEIDCDARVLARGADAADYGEALLIVGQRGSVAPAGAVALIERASQLEERIRIMTASAHRFRAWIAAACLALAATCVLAAGQLDAPAHGSDAPLKPTPDGRSAIALGGHFEKVINTRYPGLLEQQRDGTAIVILLLNEDWSVAKSAQTVSSDKIENVHPREETFAALGLAKVDVPYVGVMGMKSPNITPASVLVVFTEHATPGKRFVSHLFPDTREVDRAIFRRYFPDAVKSAVPAGQDLWVLLDRAGNVLRSGQEPLEENNWNRTLEARFPGIKTQAVTDTLITDDAGEALLTADGKDLRLHCIWLAPDSPPPG